MEEMNAPGCIKWRDLPISLHFSTRALNSGQERDANILKRYFLVSRTAMPTKTYGVLLIEDNPVDVQIVRAHLDESPDFELEVCGCLADALILLKSREFDVILLDLNLPDAVGLEGLIKLKEYVQRLAIVVLTGTNDEHLAIMALQRGAQDYLIKDAYNKRMVQAMRYAIERMRILNSHEAKKEEDNRPKQGKFFQTLTERELQVLKLLGNGASNQEIADLLSISLTTVKTHISSILQKLAVTDRTKAVVEAFRRGLI